MTNMKVSSIRLGFANNSSSSHSILIGARPIDGAPVSDFEYGWEWFHLRDEDSKLKYLAATVYDNLRGLSHEDRIDITCSIVGIRIDPDQRHLYVDHESRLDLPVDREHRSSLDRAFVSDLRDFLMRPDVSVRGGNDEDDEDVKDFGGRPSKLDEIMECSRHGLVARKDGDWWVLFDVATGNKIRLSFVDGAAEMTHASTPELVDVKITDHCKFGCKFCYQGSTPQGRHAALDDIRTIFLELSMFNTFEVAIGGGEPTSHPDFTSILRSAHVYGLTPNFTTFDMSWASDCEVAEAVRKYCGSFGVSDHSLRTIKSIGAWNRKSERNSNRCVGVLQIVEGSIPLDKLKRVVLNAREQNVNITLLGFKETGRGSGFKTWSWHGAVKELLNMGVYQFGADTVFVQKYADELDDVGVPNILRVGADGLFSMYIDAVENRFGPSSYCKPDEMVAMSLHGNFRNPLSDQISKLFPFKATAA